MKTFLQNGIYIDIKTDEWNGGEYVPPKNALIDPFEGEVACAESPQKISIDTLLVRASRKDERFIYPPGQRNPMEGWTLADRQGYIISILEEININFPFIFNRAVKDGAIFQTRLLDGGHRFLTIICFIRNEFPVRGLYWKNFTKSEKSKFLHQRSITAVTYNNLSEEDEQKIINIANCHLNMSKGEYANTAYDTDAWIKCASDLLAGTYTRNIEALFGEISFKNYFGSIWPKDTRHSFVIHLSNVAHRYALLNTTKKVVCAESGYPQIKNVIHKFYLDETGEVNTDRLEELLEHIRSLVRVFANVNLGSIKFDIFAAQAWLVEGVIYDTDKANAFFKKVHNTGNGEKLHDMWREIKSGYESKEKDQFKMKTEIIRTNM